MLRIISILLLTIGITMAKNSEIKIGDQAPDFKLLDQNNIEQTLSDYFGNNIVVYFYPKDGTPGCTKEACSIRDSFTLFEENNIIVFGISYDSSSSHKKFSEKYNLPFILLSDSAKSVAKLYNSNGYFLAKRNTFLIDTEGKIFKIYKNVVVSTHTEKILNDFSELEKLKE